MSRIASLLPSATEIVYALGLGDRLVGVSHSCDYPCEVRGKPVLSRPRFEPAGLSSGEIDAAVRHALREFGSVYEVDTERLAAVVADGVELLPALLHPDVFPSASLEGRATVWA